jgi:predicted GIY-YIG superfamily endonuclease
MSFFVYILASRRNGTLYIGMTDDLARRIWQHRIEVVPGFTKKYGVKRATRNTRVCIHARASAQKMESGMEITTYRRNEPDVARFVR